MKFRDPYRGCANGQLLYVPLPASALAGHEVQISVFIFWFLHSCWKETHPTAVSDSGNILQICSTLAMLQSETRLYWPAATGGNPHRDILHIPGHVLLTQKNPKNFPLQTGTERLALCNCPSATRTGIGNTVVSAPVTSKWASPHLKGRN